MKLRRTTTAYVRAVNASPPRSRLSHRLTDSARISQARRATHHYQAAAPPSKRQRVDRPRAAPETNNKRLQAEASTTIKLHPKRGPGAWLVAGRAQGRFEKASPPWLAHGAGKPWGHP